MERQFIDYVFFGVIAVTSFVVIIVILVVMIGEIAKSRIYKTELTEYLDADGYRWESYVYYSKILWFNYKAIEGPFKNGDHDGRRYFNRITEECYQTKMKKTLKLKIKT